MSEMGLLMQCSSEFVVRGLQLQLAQFYRWGLTTHNELLNITTIHSRDSSIIKQAFCQVSSPSPLSLVSAQINWLSEQV